MAGWYCKVAPLGGLFIIVAFMLNYWLDKIFLLRVYSTPESINDDIMKNVIASLELLPVVYICGVIEYSVRFSVSDNPFSTVIELIGYKFSLFILAGSVGIYYIFAILKELLKNRGVKKYKKDDSKKK